jgi:hypothetical protein
MQNRLNELIKTLLQDRQFQEFYKFTDVDTAMSPNLYPGLFRYGGDTLFAYGELERAKSAYSIAFQLGDTISRLKFLKTVNALNIDAKISQAYINGNFTEAARLIDRLLELCPKYRKLSEEKVKMNQINLCILTSLQKRIDYNPYSKDTTTADHEFKLDCGERIGIFPMGYADSLRRFTIIDLSSQKLVRLPNDFKSLERIREFDLSSNNFVKMPECIGVMRSLRKVNFANDSLITSIASTIENHESMKIMNLARCNTDFVNMMLSSYPYLESIKLTMNDDGASYDLSGLKKLKFIEIGVTLKPIPGSLLSNENLEIIKISRKDARYYSGDLIKFLTNYFPDDLIKRENIKFIIIERFRMQGLSKKEIEDIRRLIPKNCKIFSCVKSLVSNEYFYYDLLDKTNKYIQSSKAEIKYINQYLP